MEEEIKQYLMEKLSLNIEVEDQYDNGFILTVELELDGELINKCDKWVNIRR